MTTPTATAPRKTVPAKPRAAPEPADEPGGTQRPPRPHGSKTEPITGVPFRDRFQR
jgi:hypothetical protein